VPEDKGYTFQNTALTILQSPIKKPAEAATLW
jgi:hypothetical protein